MLTDEQVHRMYTQASAVANGFNRVRDQQARDVLSLIADREREGHARKLLEQRLAEAREKLDKAGFPGAFDDIFKAFK